MNWLLVAIGGAIGSMARYGTAALLLPATDRARFPWGTLMANWVGCLLIGYLNGLIVDRILPQPYRFLLVVGFLGGYTTFSAFGWETAAFLRDGEYARAAAYVAASNVIGVVLVIAGYALSRLH